MRIYFFQMYTNKKKKISVKIFGSIHVIDTVDVRCQQRTDFKIIHFPHNDDKNFERIQNFLEKSSYKIYQKYLFHPFSVLPQFPSPLLLYCQTATPSNVKSSNKICIQSGNGNLIAESHYCNFAQIIFYFSIQLFLKLIDNRSY